jgi:peptidoglycan/xylan/chitin deacetylase (PgdA/CDA1 family)
LEEGHRKIIFHGMNWKSIYRTLLSRGLSVVGLGTTVGIGTDQKLAALTFDDGPHPVYTPQTLKLLDEYGVLGTFFVVGEYAEKYPDIVEEIVQRGHAIGNHSYNHPSFTQVPFQECRRQIRRCSDALKPFSTNLFRPPYGAQSVRSHLTALALGYRVVTWSLAVNDWNTEDVNELSNRLVGGIRPGSIILLHDRVYGPEDVDRKSMLEALQTLLHKTRNEYQFVTLPTLLEHGPVVRRAWYRKAKNVASISASRNLS